MAPKGGRKKKDITENPHTESARAPAPNPPPIQTRASNASTRPGHIQIEADKEEARELGVRYKPKRSAEEIQAAKDAAAKEKQSKEEKIALALKKLRQLATEPDVAIEEDTTPAASPTSSELDAVLKDFEPDLLPPASTTGPSVTMLSSTSSTLTCIFDSDPDSPWLSPPNTPPVYHYFGLANTDSEYEDESYEPEPELAINKPSASSKAPAPKASRKEKALAMRAEISGVVEGEDRKRKGSVSIEGTESKKPKTDATVTKAIEKKGGLREDWRQIAARSGKAQTVASIASATPKIKAVIDENNERRLGPQGGSKMAGPSGPVVKIEFDKPKKAVDAIAVPTNKGKAKKPRNSDLGFDTQGFTTWQKAFLPTLFAYISHADTPWEMATDDQFLEDVNALFQTLYPSLEREIETTSVEYRLMSQRVYEWQGKIADFAVKNAIDYFFEHDGVQYETVEDRAQYISASLVKGLPFVYQDPERQRGIFRVSHILKTFGFVLSTLSGSLRNDEKKVGGLALATVAVHRALTLWSGGRKPGDLSDASQGKGKKAADASDVLQGFTHTLWGTATSNYVKLIKKLSDKQWQKIQTEARDAYSTVENSATVFGAVSVDGEGDDWEGMVVQDSDDDDDE